MLVVSWLRVPRILSMPLLTANACFGFTYRGRGRGRGGRGRGRGRGRAAQDGTQADGAGKAWVTVRAIAAKM
jgi:hypothetical protein